MRWMLLSIVTVVGFGVGRGQALARAADRPVQHFPFGVYWPWERTEGIARAAGKERWAFVKDTCRLLKEHGIDTIWLVNIGVEDTKALLKITRPMGLKLLPGLGEIEPRNHPQTSKVDPNRPESLEAALAYYRTAIPQVVQAIGEGREGILAWVLGDEPSGGSFALLDPMREIFAEADPGRPVVTVTMWPHTPQAVEKTRLTTFCVDLYPFFGPGSPNGPHTPEASRNFYTLNIQRMVEAAGRDGRVGWVMPMCYAEVWGPWDRRPDGATVALPGAYIHWRTPTAAEMRWQIWEGLRGGVKGIIFFVLLGPAGAQPGATPVAEASLKPILVRTPTVVGHDALLDPRGRPTPHLKVVSGVFRALAPHRALLRRLVPSRVEWLMAGSGAQVANFRDPETQDRIAVAVNPDLTAARMAELLVGPGVREVRDLARGRPLKLQPLGWAGGNYRLRVRLEAGEGMLLKAGREEKEAMGREITAGSAGYEGRDSAVLQKAVDHVAAAGGGVVRVPAGEYTMHDALHLRSGVRVVGEKGAVLKKVPSITVPIADFIGYGHYEFTVTQPELLRVGMGVHLCDDNSGGFYDTVATIVGRRDELFFINRMLNHDYLPTSNGRVTTLFSLVEGCDIHDVSVEGLVLDGNPEETRSLNGCRGGGVFLLKAHRVRVEGVEVRNYKGDAVSFQQCTDIIVRNCHLHHNSGTGLHPGSGSVRYIMQGNHVHDNGGYGVFYCLRTTHSICAENRLENNGQDGISVGERDTDHLIRGNTIVGNRLHGIHFRRPLARGGDRVRVEGNTVGPNCRGDAQYEIGLEPGLSDVHLSGNTIVPAKGKALFVGAGCARISFSGNKVGGRAQQPEDVEGARELVRWSPPAQLPPVGPAALPRDGARHLSIDELPVWRE